MDHRAHRLDEQTLTSERAFEWLHRLDRGGGQDAFRKWLHRSPQHIGEVLVARSTELVMRELFRDKRISIEPFLSASASVVEMDDRPTSRRLPGRTRRLRLLAFAALALIVAVALFVQPAEMLGSLRPNQYVTSVGEQRAIELPDGSVIALDAQSSVRAEFTARARDIYLKSGRAMFTVAKDAKRPFRVHVLIPGVQGHGAGKDTIIEARGTKFDVNRRSDRIRVAVVEGTVQVFCGRMRSAGRDHAREPTEVRAGQGVSVERTGSITAPAPVEISDVSAWQQRRLVFTDRTLEEIVEEFQRYNRTPRIRIESDALRTQRFSGTLDADDPEALLTYLDYDDSIALARIGDDIVIRSRSAAAPAPATSD